MSSSFCVYLFSRLSYSLLYFFFFFNDTATTEIYTLSLHDALPILPSPRARADTPRSRPSTGAPCPATWGRRGRVPRSEEHTSELQSLAYLVCRLLLEKKKNTQRSAARYDVNKSCLCDALHSQIEQA